MIGRWLRAPELDTAGETAFRADAGAPSRPRALLELRGDGTFVEAGVGPADRQVPGSGTWVLQDDHLVLRGEGRAGPARSLRVVSAGPGRLLLGNEGPR